jgi:hypothetical protein
MITATTTPVSHEDRNYDALLERLQARFTANVDGGTRLFTTDTPDLYTAFLDALPASERQHHNCSACRKFVNTFGGLVTIAEDGTTQAALWHTDDAPELYQAALRALLQRIQSAPVNGVFYSIAPVWGTPVTEPWRHFSVTPPASLVFKRVTQTAGQARAERHEDYGTLQRALAEFTMETLATAITLLKTDSLYRSEKCLGVATWLLALHQQRAATKHHQRRDAIVWRAVAYAPAGYCHPRSSMIGSLLEDIAAGRPFSEISARFAAKMNPTQYQRAQAAPSAGAIQQAEKLFSERGLAPALLRRYATLGELPPHAVLWSPSTEQEQPSESGGAIFKHVQAKGAASPAAVVTPSVTMTWEKFQKTVLPTARVLEVLVPPSSARFMALVTAVDPSAPPILQWDRPDDRNAFSWYYASGIDAEMRRRLVQAGGRFDDIDIRCSLMWNNRNDLDLHCMTPRGDHIFYANKQACRFGGWLDVDMNVHGETDKPVENIRWERGHAPEGRYQFYANLYRTHYGAAVRTPFTVEVEVEGQVFTMVDETRGGNSSNYVPAMVLVADFEYRRGKPVQVNGATAMETAAASPNAWGVTPGSYVRVSAIVRSPNLWGKRPLEQHGQHAFFLMHDCRDMQQGVGRGFFTETLQSDLRPVRAVLEAYVATAAIDGAQDASACGIGISNASTSDITLRVTSPTGRAVYQLDRWD